MGYACPVCWDPQADAGHLANHLAFTAMLGDDPHESWLDEHAPGWAEMGEEDLADVVVDEVEETEFPQVFEDTAGGLEDGGDPPEERSGALFDDEAPGGQLGHGHEPGEGNHGHGHQHAHDSGQGASAGGDAPMDDEAEAILEEAREMTRRMLEDDADADADAGADDSTDGDDAGSDDVDGSDAADTASDADSDNNE